MLGSGGDGRVGFKAPENKHLIRGSKSSVYSLPATSLLGVVYFFCINIFQYVVNKHLDGKNILIAMF